MADENNNDSNNTNNSTPENQTPANSAPDNAKPDTTPPADSNSDKPEPTPETQPPASDTPPTTDNPEDAKDDSKTAQTSTAASDSNVIKFSVDGLVKGSREFPKGTKVGKALAEFTNSPNDLALRDSKNRAVSMDRELNDNIEVTATKKAANG